MTKQLIISSCDECPYSYYAGYDLEDGTLYFKCENKKFPFGRSNWAIKDQIMDDCPLNDYESSIGDLTPEDIQRINETARQIKNAKNVRDGRYG